MKNYFATAGTKNGIKIISVRQKEFARWLQGQTQAIKDWLQSTGFVFEPGKWSFLPEAKVPCVLFCLSDKTSFWAVGVLPFSLPPGNYYFNDFVEDDALVWGLGAYQFTKYKKPLRQPAKLILPKKFSAAKIMNLLQSIYLIRDLINTPTEDMGPTALSAVAKKIAQNHAAKFTQIVGDQLLKRNYPAIHAVGRAATDAPRLIDLRWGKSRDFKVTLVGKGVCFDTGGLDLKTSAAMLLMKKDMGGAAHVLGLAQMIMHAKLPICLRVLIPAVENSVSGNSYRPGDVIQSRAGKTIEIGNTDAEGRVVLADALAEAVSDSPDLIIDIATLTGAARVALGTELPALFSNNEDLAAGLLKQGLDCEDPTWRMPLFASYRNGLQSSIADLNNCPADGYAGAIVAALFLQEFVPDHIPWVHLDLMAWNLRYRPGRPIGGEAMAVRGIFNYLQMRTAV